MSENKNESAPAREHVSTYELAFPGRFLKAGLFQDKHVTLTVADAFMEELEGDKGKEKRLILHFKETDKELVANKTCAFAIKEMFGNRLADWLGKRVTFFPTTTQFGPKTVDCIRVWGSPDIPADIPVSARIGRKQYKATMHRVEK